MKRIGGHLAIDFVNTVNGRRSPDRLPRGRDYREVVVGDYLATPKDLLQWASEAGVITAREASGWIKAGGAADQAVLLAAAVELREALYRLFKATLEGWVPSPDAIAIVERAAKSARLRQRLASTDGQLTWRWIPNVGSERVLGEVALAGVDLLTSPRRESIRQCPADQCGWLFLDATRNRSRRWCDMSDCGNLAKVRRFRGKR